MSSIHTATNNNGPVPEQGQDGVVGRLPAVESFSSLNLVFNIESPSPAEGLLTINVGDRGYKNIGQIKIENLGDIAMAAVLETMLTQSSQKPGVDVISASSLKEALETAHGLDGRVTSDFAGDIEDIVQAYKESISRAPVKKTHLASMDIENSQVVKPDGDDLSAISSGREGVIRWKDITDPTRKTSREISEQLGISNGTVRLCLNDAPAMTACSLQGGLFISTRELSYNSNSGKLHESPLIVLVGKEHVVTVHQGESPASARVWREVLDKNIITGDISYSNYLATRIIGSTIHSAKEAMEGIQASLDRLNAGPDNLMKAEKISRAARKMEQVVTRMDEIIQALQEKEHLFGAPSPRQSLHRYSAIVRSLVDQSRMIEKEIGDKRNSWQIAAQNYSNLLVNRLTMVVGMIAIPSAVSSFFSQQFEPGTLTNKTIGTVYALSAVAGVVLISGLGWSIKRLKSRQIDS